MTNSQSKLSKDERLAAKLRENLRRRKAQARALEPNPHPAEENTADSASESRSAALPKGGVKS